MIRENGIVRFGQVRSYNLIWVKHSRYLSRRQSFNNLYKITDVFPQSPMEPECLICLAKEAPYEYVCRVEHTYYHCCSYCAEQIKWIIELLRLKKKHPLLTGLCARDYINRDARNKKFLDTAKMMVSAGVSAVKYMMQIVPPELARAIVDFMISARCQDICLDKIYLRQVIESNA